MRRWIVLPCALALLAFFVAGSVGAETDFPRGMAGKRSVQGAGFDKQHGPFSQIECAVTATGSNTKLDCDDPFPNNEPQIGVNPVDPSHMIASSNDFGTCCDQFYTTFDGGQHWQTGNMSRENANKTGSDPVTVFDRKHGVALHSSLSYSTLHAAGTQACDGDVVVSISRDGGLTWEIPVQVDDGIGCDLSKTQLFNDKEWITVDNNPASPFYGRAYLTWTKFESHDGAYASSAIFESQSDDGGEHWAPAREISGSNSNLCTFQVSGPAGECDENQFSVPTVAPNGTVYVAFQNEQNQSLWESANEFDDQYLVVKSTNGGATWSSPSFVVGLEDGARDYPLNVDGRQTLTGYQIRVNSTGNIVASPIDGKLYLVYADNSAGTHDSATPVTNTNVYVMTSTNGTQWTGPFPVDTGAGDQWFPWADVNPASGNIGVLYNDRPAAGSAVHNASLAEGLPGSFAKTIVSTAVSHPTQSRFFKAGVPGCEACARFHGDYIGVAYGSDGRANMVWTDMRDADPTVPGVFDQFIYFARK